MKRLISDETLQALNSIRFPYSKVSQRYRDMKDRCEKPHHPAFKYYGGKGVKVLLSREEFVLWFVHEYQRFLKTHTIYEKASVGRKDHSLDYSLDNIEITTHSENSKEMYSRHGNKSPMASLYDDLQILTMYTLRKRRTMLWKHYNTGPTTVGRIVTGRRRPEFYKAYGSDLL